ncbi:hypothetical protein V6N12_062466 [Hibiscus sabdariffa]|uniref:Putative plant transposon protein domain-containing protein n=1 Tax=Hibiscus sabdariffa TaxID=183260 RepID=A0ABR2F8X9_9ROSI
MKKSRRSMMKSLIQGLSYLTSPFEESHLGFTPEFMSVVAMHKGTCVCFDVDYVNNMFNFPRKDAEHESFACSLTSTNRNKIVADLCKDGTHWILATKGSQCINRVALRSPARGWNHLLKASLMPTSHNDTVSEERMALLQSFITGMKINYNVPKIDLDKAHAVKGIVISAATWRQLSEAEPKEKEKAIREALTSITPGAMPTFPTFLGSLIAGDCSQPASPKTNSSTPSNATKPFTPIVDESSKT